MKISKEINKELIGHNNTKMTLNYTRLNDDKKLETLNKRKSN
jgi:hypothetical protein